jgi:hypothetical protein
MSGAPPAIMAGLLVGMLGLWCPIPPDIMGLALGEPGIMHGLSIPGVFKGPVPAVMVLETGQPLRPLLGHDCIMELAALPTAFMLFITLLFCNTEHKNGSSKMNINTGYIMLNVLVLYYSDDVSSFSVVKCQCIFNLSC